MVGKHDKVLLRKVDLTSGESPAASQAQSQFQVEGIPHLRVFDGQGGQHGTIVGADLAAIEAAVNKALAK